jgi:hypothetical protein
MGCPQYLCRGWLKTSAALGQPGNTALTGHHNIGGEVSLPGETRTQRSHTLYARIDLFYKVQSRVSCQRLAKRFAANARWIQSTTDERIVDYVLAVHRQHASSDYCSETGVARERRHIAHALTSGASMNLLEYSLSCAPGAITPWNTPPFL